ncbi:MAG: sulfurtransferase [Gammaproteobacteria bacterium]|nr:sulfurtransferase [Gammaproteobacteria bacterium]MDH4253875.1 sulfurtransferase [Gammaproteobacteria bacterium]MDH5309812.1 sulfurtransferase [Gammaproteobacteria bacterium]
MATVFAPLGTQELAASLADPRTRVVDCRFFLLEPERGRRDYLAGHIPGAAYADLDLDLSARVTPESGRHPLPDPDEFVLTLRRLGISRTTRVVVYDDGPGAVAARLWWMLRWVGHDDVVLLDGGFAAWTQAGLPVESGRERIGEGDFERTGLRDLVWTTADVELLVTGGRKLLLVDARDAARFRGEAEPIDRVAGHVPGAQNLPFPVSLTGTGTWKSARELAAAWSAVGPVTAGQPWGVMCGSGVTACHLALSAMLAGLPEPRLYAGSWSEWIRDARRPVASGPRAPGGDG